MLQSAGLSIMMLLILRLAHKSLARMLMDQLILTPLHKLILLSHKRFVQ